MEYIYPAVFCANDDGSYTITFPDLPGCISEAKTLGSALRMAQSALKQWIQYLQDKRETIPAASLIQGIVAGEREFVSMVCAEIKDGHAVKRTVSIPRWMDEKAIHSGLSLSRVLQDALAAKFEM